MIGGDETSTKQMYPHNLAPGDTITNFCVVKLYDQPSGQYESPGGDYLMFEPGELWIILSYDSSRLAPYTIVHMSGIKSNWADLEWYFEHYDAIERFCGDRLDR